MSSETQSIAKKLIQEDQPFWNKINWKYSLFALIPFFYLYPKALVFIVNPFVKPFVQSYRKTNQLQNLPQTLILTDSKYFDLEKTLRKATKLRGKNVKIEDYYVIDLFGLPEAQRPQNNRTISLWAQTIVNKLQHLGKTNPLVIIKASAGVLQGIQIIIYRMKLQQSYKIGLYGQNVHCLFKNDARKSYQRQIFRKEV